MEEARLQMHRVNTGGTLMPPFNAGIADSPVNPH